MELNRFYNDCNAYRNRDVTLNFAHNEYIEANLSAMLVSFVYRLRKECGIQFSLEAETENQGYEVLVRNGLLHQIADAPFVPDPRKCTIPVRYFYKSDVDGLARYIESDLLGHRGVPKLPDVEKTKMKDSYFEIFDNYEVHAQSEDPVFACG